jgi:hypothetical protein
VSHQTPLLRCLATLLLLALARANAGIVVTQTEKGFSFSDAVAISVNGKDKVLSIGADPKAVAGKYPNVKLGEPMFRDHATSFFALRGEGSVNYIIPEGLAKGTQPDLAADWSSARIAAKASDKTTSDIPAATFVAFLPGGLQELVSLAKSEQDVRFIDSSDKAFATQLSLIAAIATAYPNQAESAPLQRYVEWAMRSRYEAVKNGSANVEVLDQALQYADISKAVYPTVAEQAMLRGQVAQLKSYLDRKVAVMRALAAGHAWDEFIISSSDFDQYEKSFPDLVPIRTQALKSSLDLHRKEGEELLTEHDYGGAYKQFRLASTRQPSDKLLQQRVVSSRASYSREFAIDNQNQRKQLDVGQREILNQSVQFANSYKNENKLDLALKSITDAENVDPDSLPMLLKKAEILGARSQFAEAFEALDRYDLHAVDEEREKSSALRNDLLFKQKSTLEDVKEQMQKALADGQYVKVHELAMKGLSASDNDPDLLFQAATASIVSRDTQKSQDLFRRYLAITNTLDANPEQRARVRTLLAGSAAATAEGTGERNWLSGKKLPSNVFYCPISLAFQPKVDHIDASGKMKVGYEWSGDQLVSITPTFEKVDKNTGEKRISFVYNPKFPQVLVASEGDVMRPALSAADPDDVLKHSSLIVLNNPYIDPDAVQKLTGKNVSLGISGNSFFQPFVWDRIHYFQFTYDSSGRVAHAVELAGPNGAPSGITLDFDWQGQQLEAIHGFRGADPAHRSKIYDRSLEYQGGQLVSEEISASGKRSHIKYTYNGSRPASAQCTTDTTLDDRSRQVTFR